MKIDYVKLGNGLKNLVLLPGVYLGKVCTLKDVVMTQYALLLDDFTIYLFDRPEFIAENTTIEQIADETVALIKEIGIDKFYLVGCSYGGMISQVITVRYPELVEKLFLTSTVPYLNRQSKKVANSWIKLAQQNKIKQLASEMLDSMYYPDNIKDVNDSLVENFTKTEATEVTRFIRQIQSYVNYDYLVRIKTIACPVMVVGILDDKVFPINNIKKLLTIPGCQSYIYQGPYGHCVYDEASDYVAKIKEFLLA